LWGASMSQRPPSPLAQRWPKPLPLSKGSSPPESRPQSGNMHQTGSALGSRRASAMVNASNYDILLTSVNHDERQNTNRERQSSLSQDVLDLAAALQSTSQVGKGAPDSGTAEEEPSTKTLSFGPGSSPAPNLPAHLFQVASPSKKQIRFTRSEGNANGAGKLKYPVEATEPPSPTLVLSEHRSQAWQQQVAAARRGTSGADDAGNFADTSDGDFTAVCEPPLEWYADELHRTCGQALVHTSHQIVSLQARHRASPALLGEKSLLRPLLFQAVTVISGVCYHVRRAVHALARKVEIGLGNRTLMAGSGRSNRRSLGGALLGASGAGVSAAPGAAGRSSILGVSRSRTHGHLEDLLLGGAAGRQDGSQSLPSPPFAPRDADDAFAALHLDVAQLQVAGQQLGVAIRRLISNFIFAMGQNVAGGSSSAGLAMPVDELRRLLDAVQSKGDASPDNRLQQLFMALPCLEEAIEQVGVLSYLIDNRQVAAKVQDHFNLQTSKRRDQEDADAGIVNDSAGLDMDAGFDDWDQGFSMDKEVGSKLLGIVEAAKQHRAASARPPSAGRPSSASARPPSAGRPSSASAHRRGVSPAPQSISVVPVAQSTTPGRESTSAAASREGSQTGSRRQSTSTGAAERNSLSPSTLQVGDMRRAAMRGPSPAPSDLLAAPELQEDASRSASKRQVSREPDKRTPEKGKKKKGRG